MHRSVGGAHGINFVLPVDPKTGDKSCPDCGELLFYSDNEYAYNHRIPVAPTVFHAQCPFCKEEFQYLDDYKYLPFCGKCHVRANRQLNPNFVGNDIVNQAMVVHNSDGKTIDFGTGKPIIKPSYDPMDWNTE